MLSLDNMFKFIKNKEIILFAVFVSLLIPVSGVLATIELPPLQTNWPPTPVTGHTLDVGSNITDLVRYFYEWGIALGGLAAFVALIIAGFLYLTSVGDPGKMKEAIDRIKSAFFGLVLLLGSFLILHTINPELTVLRPIVFRPEDVPRAGLPGARLLDPPEPCVKAILFKGANFEGEFFTMDPGDQRRNLPFEPKSFKLCREMTEEEIREEKEGKIVRHQYDRCQLFKGSERVRDEHPHLIKKHPHLRKGYYRPIEDHPHPYLIEGGACTLQLFDGGWFGLGCGGPVVEIGGPRIANIANIMGVEEIKCLELVAVTPPPDIIKPRLARLSDNKFQGHHRCHAAPHKCCPHGYEMCTFDKLEKHVQNRTVYGEGQGWVMFGDALKQCWLTEIGSWESLSRGEVGPVYRYFYGDEEIIRMNSCDTFNHVWCCP